MCVSAFESKMKLNEIINNISDGILSYDKNKNINFFNNKCEDIFNVPESHALGQNLSIFLAGYGIKDLTDEDNKECIIILRGKSYAVKVKNDNILNESIIIFSNIGELKEIQNKYQKFLRAGHVAKYSFHNIIGESRIMRKTVDMAKKFAISDLPVLIEGSSGTGKELFASAIHNYSYRKDKPFVAFNCAALNENLLESELFGYNEGAFTGAAKKGKEGLFEIADGGTVFLDEIGDMPFGLQAKLLRVLQEKEIIRVGGINIIPINIRIIAATNKNLHKLVRAGTFREDLYYRLCTLCLHIPSLRERIEDLDLIIDYFKEKYDARFKLSSESYRVLTDYEWPGNVREAESCVQYIKILNKSTVGIDDLPNNICEYLKISSEESPEIDSVDEGILSILYKLHMDNKITGRSKMRELLHNRGICLSEQEVRVRLYKMQSDGYVLVNKGRRGTTITNMGIDYMERLVKLVEVD